MHEPRVGDGGTVGPVDGLQVPRFAGHSTFARLPRLEDVDDYRVAVVGVPFDAGVTYRPGARSPCSCRSTWTGASSSSPPEGRLEPSWRLRHLSTGFWTTPRWRSSSGPSAA